MTRFLAWLPALNSLLISFGIVFILRMWRASRDWTASVQETRLRLVEDEMQMVRANMMRDGRTSIERAHNVEARLADIEQAIGALPCAQVTCPPTLKEDLENLKPESET